MQRANLLAILVVCTLPFGCNAKNKISDEHRAELSVLHSAIAAENAERSTERREALLAAWNGLRPDPAGGECPMTLPAIDSTEFQVHAAIIEVRMLSKSYDLDGDMPMTTGLTRSVATSTSPTRTMRASD